MWRAVPQPDQTTGQVKDEPIDLATRITLRPKEAARALGVSEGTLRTLLPDMPHFREGSCVLIPVLELRQWASDRTKQEKARHTLTVDQLMASLNI